MTPTEGQRPLRSSEPEEVDPTGIRDLLRGLPDPGPMPEDLVARISARLTVEQTHREQADQDDVAARSDSVVDLAAERSRRRPGRTVAYLGVAAAGLLLTTVAVSELSGGPLFGGAGGLDSAAQVSTQSRAAGDAGGAGGAEAGGAADMATAAEGEAADQDESAEAAGQDESAEAAGQDEAAEEAGAEGEAAEGEAAMGDGTEPAGQGLASTGADLTLLPPLGEVTVGGYRQAVLASVRDGDGARPAAAQGGDLTQAGADSCWRAGLDGQDWSSRHAAAATLDGAPVVVLVGQDGAAGVVALLPRSCTSGDPVEPLDRVSWGS